VETPEKDQEELCLLRDMNSSGASNEIQEGN